MNNKEQERGGSDVDDLEISRKAIAGDEAAFLALLQKHKEDLLRTALALLKSDHDALETLPIPIRFVSN